jgi:NitT/TauT family transport system substrate-binding protein
MLKLLLLFLFLSGVLTGGVFATGTKEVGSAGASEDSGPVVVRIGTLRGPTSVGMAPILAEPDRLQPAGGPVETRPTVFATPDLLVSQILAGEIDIAALPTNLAANLRGRGTDLQLLAVSGGGVLYVVADEPISWEDLRGRTIHTLARGATPDILFQALARERGLEPGEDFTIQYSADQTELAQQLITGRVDLAVLPEPFVTRVIQANPDLQVVMDLGVTYREIYGGGTYPMTVLTVTRTFADRHPEVLAEFVRAYQEGLDWFENNREAGAHAAAERIGIPAPVVIDAFERLNMVFIPASVARNEVEQFLQIFYAFNPRTIGGELPDDDFYRR